VIYPNGHSDNNNTAVIQEPAENEARNNDLPLPPDATVPLPKLGSRSNRIALSSSGRERSLLRC
jgi:hypothetical protein